MNTHSDIEGIDEHEESAVILDNAILLSYAAGNLASAFIMEKNGRKMMILVALTLAFSMLLILSFTMYESNDDGAYESAAETEAWKHTERIIFLIASSIYVLSIAIGMSGTVWSLTTEIFPLYLLGTASSFGGAFGWAVNFTISSIFLNVLDDDTGRWVIFLIMAVLCIFAFLFVMFMVPDTIGNSVMENLVDMLGDEWVTAQKKRLKKEGIRFDYKNINADDKIGKNL